VLKTNTSAPGTSVLSIADLMKLQNVAGLVDQGPLASYFLQPT
jgi:hypothetical protein